MCVLRFVLCVGCCVALCDVCVVRIVYFVYVVCCM